MNEHPALYAIAKQITLEAGFAYTDPRTGVTTQPASRTKSRRKNRHSKTKGQNETKTE